MGTELVLPIETEAFLTHLTVERGRSERTVRAYRSDLLRYCGFLSEAGVDPLRATEADVEAWSAQLRSSGLAPSSVTRMLVSLRGMYRHLQGEGIIEVDPAAAIELPGGVDSLPKALPQQDVATMLDTVAGAAAGGGAVDLRDSALLEFLYGTGARVSEACGLGFGDLDLDARLARVLGKRDKERLVPLGRPVVDAMGKWLDTGRPELVGKRGTRDDADAVFLGARGRRLSRQAAWTTIRRRAAEAGITAEISPHVLRHSCATHMLEGGADIRTVAELLGHASVSTTQVYTRVATDSLFDSYRAAHPRAAASTSVAAGGTR